MCWVGHSNAKHLSVNPKGAHIIVFKVSVKVSVKVDLRTKIAYLSFQNGPKRPHNMYYKIKSCICHSKKGIHKIYIRFIHTDSISGGAMTSSTLRRGRRATQGTPWWMQKCGNCGSPAGSTTTWDTWWRPSSSHTCICTGLRATTGSRQVRWRKNDC